MPNLGAAEILALIIVAVFVLFFFRSQSRSRVKQRPQAGARVETEPSEAVATRLLERERVIERQVLVQRCRYCNALTPVDLSECTSCGTRDKIKA